MPSGDPITGDLLTGPRTPRKRKGPKSKSSKIHFEVQQLRQKCLELRLSGLSIARIGETVGRDQSTVHHHLMALLEDLREENRDGAVELRALELARLDKLLFGVWTKALDGDPPAVALSLKILERRARLLGLDAPVKVTTPIGHPFELAAVGAKAAGDALVDYSTFGEQDLAAAFVQAIRAPEPEPEPPRADPRSPAATAKQA